MENQLIKSARSFTRNDRHLVCFNGNIVVSATQVTQATGLQSNFDLLVGGNISATFYKKDEEMRNSTVCTADNIIVKEFTIELPEVLLKYKMAAAFGAKIAA